MNKVLIKYKKDRRGMLATLCPFRQVDVYVGSASCDDCRFFYSTNRTKQEVICRGKESKK